MQYGYTLIRIMGNRNKLNYSNRIINLFNRCRDSYWHKVREQMCVSLFHSAAKRVPAYRDFLKKNKIDPSKIKTYADFCCLPPVNKKDYLRKYPLKYLMWDGSLNSNFVFSATSGSTGKPYYFPRLSKIEYDSSIVHEIFVRHSSYGPNMPTLVIVCFGMGVWIGGIITYRAFEMVGERGYPISVIAPGINKKEIFNALINLAPNFSQIILAGYPPFIKDVIDESKKMGLSLDKMNIRLLFAAESFTERFREYVVKRAGLKNIYLDTMNIYGSADIGTMAFETPTAILIRRLAMESKRLFKEIFSSIIKTPTLAQYNPFSVVFEQTGGDIIITGDNAIPFVRYNIGDHGGVFDYCELDNLLREHNINLSQEMHRAGIDRYLYRLPFVYVYERSDLSTTLYGLQIYPEFIKEALFNNHLTRYTTGKFAMLTKFDRSQNQFLEINVELKKGYKASPDLERKIRECIVSTLKLRSSEFRELYQHLGRRVLPKVILWPAEHPSYFRPGIKQQWVVKSL